MKTTNTTPQVLLPQINWSELYFYQKAEVLYQMSVVFCKRFLPHQGDRTVDQIIQAARSGKQNIVEGMADGVTSTEMQLKLLNVARSSIQELQEDFRDQLGRYSLEMWKETHPRYDQMLNFCREHNKLSDYQDYFEKWTMEEMANIGFTLCRMVDKMMMSFIKKLEEEFVEKGGIKERMHAARTGYREGVDKRLQLLEKENHTLREEIARLRIELAQMRSEKHAIEQQLHSLALK